MTAAVLPVRLLAYARERFPIGPSLTSAALIGLTSDLVAQAASASGALRLDARSLVVVGTVFSSLLLLRVADEHKDLAADRVAHPDRPVPRGLVSLRELALVAALATILTTVANALVAPVALAAWALVLAYAGLMWRELFLGDWLRRRLLIYLATHQVIVPLLVLYAFSARAESGVLPWGALAWTCVLATGASAAFEVGRKLRAPEEERDGEETYSRPLGPTGASLLAAAVGAVSFCGAVALAWSLSLGAGLFVALAALATLLLSAPLRFALRPSVSAAKPLMAAGAFVSLATWGGVLVALLVDRPLTFAWGLG
jgi:4-hydroxybenzoate polyprenyltransferase